VLLVLALVAQLLLVASVSATTRRAPANRALPHLIGRTVVGSTLRATRGLWANTPTRFSFRWLLCDKSAKRCSWIKGAKRSKYTLAARTAGHRVRVAVRAWNAHGSTQVLSSASAPVATNGSQPSPPAPPPSPPPPPPPPRPPARGVVLTEDLGWAPVSPAKLPWAAINQLILFNLATKQGPGLDASNIENINVPVWVATAHAHPGVKAIIAIGGAGNDNWSYACSDANRAQFVQNLVGFATSNRFDGIDLDIEDGPWSAQRAPVAAMTNCIEAISNATHSAGMFLSADVITNWQGPWYAPSQVYVDQYNLMTYGDDLATMQRDVKDTIDQGLPASKFVVGVDVEEHPQPGGGCGQFSRYAAQAGLMGAFVWDAAADARAGNACANGLAAG
jgi:hypothetical protein